MCVSLGEEVPGHYQEQLKTALILIVRLKKTHLFSLFQILGPPLASLFVTLPWWSDQGCVSRVDAGILDVFRHGHAHNLSLGGHRVNVYLLGVKDELGDDDWVVLAQPGTKKQACNLTSRRFQKEKYLVCLMES